MRDIIPRMMSGTELARGSKRNGTFRLDTSSTLQPDRDPEGRRWGVYVEKTERPNDHMLIATPNSYS